MTHDTEQRLQDRIYVYFVSYYHETQVRPEHATTLLAPAHAQSGGVASGFGMAEIRMDHAVSSIEDVQLLAGKIIRAAARQLHGVSVAWYSLLRVEAVPAAEPASARIPSGN